MAPIRRQQELELFKEPTTTPGIIPLHLKRATATENPIIEVVQRILSHLKPGTGASVEKLLALIALFKVLSPAWHHVQELFLWAFTSRINVNELDPVANDIILWIATEVVDKRLTMDATVTSGTTGAIPPEFLNYHSESRSITLVRFVAWTADEPSVELREHRKLDVANLNGSHPRPCKATIRRLSATLPSPNWEEDLLVNRLFRPMC